MTLKIKKLKTENHINTEHPIPPLVINIASPPLLFLI